MRCIVAAGLQCAGKTSFLQVARQGGAATLEWSDLLKRELGPPAVASRAERFEQISNVIRERGYSYYPKLAYASLITVSALFHVVSGARNPLELEELAKHYTQTTIVWVEADASIRYSRMNHRNRSDQIDSFESFLKYDYMELRSGLCEIASSCQQPTFFLINNGRREILNTVSRHLSSAIMADNADDTV